MDVLLRAAGVVDGIEVAIAAAGPIQPCIEQQTDGLALYRSVIAHG